MDSDANCSIPLFDKLSGAEWEFVSGTGKIRKSGRGLTPMVLIGVGNL